MTKMEGLINMNKTLSLIFFAKKWLKKTGKVDRNIKNNHDEPMISNILNIRTEIHKKKLNKYVSYNVESDTTLNNLLGGDSPRNPIHAERRRNRIQLNQIILQAKENLV